jgi:5-methylcytosine-specific restriction endonuclease McrA
MRMGKSRAQIAQNKAKVRALLTEDPLKWSRECVLPYPSKFERSIDLLHAAASAVAIGEEGKSEAQSLIGQMDDFEMRTWFDDLAQNAGKVRLEILGQKPNPQMGKSSIRRPSKKLELSIIARDGFHCRYCGIRIVPNDQLKNLQSLVGYMTLPNRSRAYGRTKNSDIHGIWLMTRATVDHVEPVASGAVDVNREDNLVASCWSCNYAKWRYTIGDLRLDHPKCRPVKLTHWRGLTDFAF